MRIAVACQGLDVAPRFARSSSFMCYRVDRGMFADCQNMPNLSFPPAQLAQVLKDLDVSVMIVNRIDPTSETALKAAGIEVQAGYTGTDRMKKSMPLLKDRYRGVSRRPAPAQPAAAAPDNDKDD